MKFYVKKIIYFGNFITSLIKKGLIFEMQNPASEQIPIESQFDSTSPFAAAGMVQLGGFTYSLQMCALCNIFRRRSRPR
jgi:hypothetical protein